MTNLKKVHRSSRYSFLLVTQQITTYPHSKKVSESNDKLMMLWVSTRVIVDYDNND